MNKSLAISAAATLAILQHANGASTINLDGPWYTGTAAATAGTPSFSPNNTSTSFTWGSGAAGDGSSALRGILWTYFTDTSLVSDGDSIRVSFTAQWSAAATAGSSAFRFGLFDNNGLTRSSNLVDANTDAAFGESLGYFTTVNLGGGTGVVGTQVHARTGGDPNVLSIAVGSQRTQVGSNTTSANALPANIAYDFSLMITRNSATEYALDTVAASGGITNATTELITADTFNSFYLLNSAQTGLNSITFSNFEITAIPEPATALLGGLGLLALLRRRRTA